MEPSDLPRRKAAQFNQSLQPTPVGVVSSADAGHVVVPAWLSFCRWATRTFMRAFAAILFSLVLPCVLVGNQPPPAWHAVDGTIRFFKEKGFEFLVDDSMAKHYKKPTAEISIVIPDQFADSGLTNTFSSVEILSDDLSTDLGTHEHAGKKRIILTISEAMAKTSKAAFYFRNNSKGVTHGSMYRLDLAKVLDDWRKVKK